jgi:hypothetical protein
VDAVENRPSLSGKDIPMFFPSLVHHSNGDSSCASDFAIKFAVDIRALQVACSLRRPFRSPDRDDECGINYALHLQQRSSSHACDENSPQLRF